MEDKLGEEDEQQRLQFIAQWREGAYRNSKLLRDAGTNAVRAEVAAKIEQYAAASAQALRQAFSYPPGTGSSDRDAYCKGNTRVSNTTSSLAELQHI